MRYIIAFLLCLSFALAYLSMNADLLSAKAFRCNAYNIITDSINYRIANGGSEETLRELQAIQYDLFKSYDPEILAEECSI